MECHIIGYVINTPNEENWDIGECYIFHNFILSS